MIHLPTVTPLSLSPNDGWEEKKHIKIDKWVLFKWGKCSIQEVESVCVAGEVVSGREGSINLQAPQCYMSP